MGNIPKDYTLKPDDRTSPVLWVSGPRELPRIPDASDEVMAAILDEKRTRRLKSWGHDNTGAHWLITRAGLPLHEDRGFTRYTHQLIVRNDGWRLCGIDEQLDLPKLVPGMLVCLDTWSPHRVVRDTRYPDAKTALYKCMIVVDRDEPLTPDEVWDTLSPRLYDESIAEGISKWTGRSPGYKKPTTK